MSFLVMCVLFVYVDKLYGSFRVAMDDRWQRRTTIATTTRAIKHITVEWLLAFFFVVVFWFKIAYIAPTGHNLWVRVKIRN